MSACQTRRTKIAYPYWRNRATLAMSHIGHEDEPENTRRRIRTADTPAASADANGPVRRKLRRLGRSLPFSALPRAPNAPHPGTQNMIERLLLTTYAAYLVAAFPILDTMTAMRVTPTHHH
jgi:hypothetical protein